MSDIYTLPIKSDKLKEQGMWRVWSHSKGLDTFEEPIMTKHILNFCMKTYTNPNRWKKQNIIQILEKNGWLLSDNSSDNTWANCLSYNMGDERQITKIEKDTTATLDDDFEDTHMCLGCATYISTLHVSNIQNEPQIGKS